MAKTQPRLVIIGGGFAGFALARGLAGTDYQITLIDRKNHHVFQPLLYQVATAALSPGEIAQPLRRMLRKAENVKVLLGEVSDFDRERREVVLADGSRIGYDLLALCAGARHSYFGHPEWEAQAPGLKTLEDALEMRRRLLLIFEEAERRADAGEASRPLHLCVIGGGPTGVELAGALADIARHVLAEDFRAIDTREAQVHLYEGSDRLLSMFPPAQSRRAETQLRELGVQVHKGRHVTAIEPGRLRVGEEWVPADLALWATGIAASPLGSKLAEAYGLRPDKAGRLTVTDTLQVPGHPELYVLGDLASLQGADGKPVPALASAAMQEGAHVAANLAGVLQGRDPKPFRYLDKGIMATIGRNRAVAQLGPFGFWGFPAWLIWVGLHVWLLTGFRNRVSVFIDWIWAYFSRERSARLIMGSAPSSPTGTGGANSAGEGKPAPQE